MSLISGFPNDGVVTINRVILKPQYTVDDLQERVAMLCENVKTYHSDTGFVGGFVALNSGAISNEGSTIGQTVESPFKGKEALIVTFWNRGWNVWLRCEASCCSKDCQNVTISASLSFSGLCTA